jgi:hypothetical protein
MPSSSRPLLGYTRLNVLDQIRLFEDVQSGLSRDVTYITDTHFKVPEYRPPVGCKLSSHLWQMTDTLFPR